MALHCLDQSCSKSLLSFNLTITSFHIQLYCHQEDFLPLYDLQYSFLWVTFSGKTEDELSGHLESVRECAKRMGMHWARRRACFLLGRLCARKLKLSQVWTHLWK